MTAAGRTPRMAGMSAFSRISRRVALAAALAMIALPALPQASGGYTVELVFFRNGGETGAMSDGASRAVSGGDVSATPVTARRLGAAAAKLNGGGRRVIAHAAWRQAAAGVSSRRGVSAAEVGLSGVTGKIIIERGTFVMLGLDLVVEDNGRRYRIYEMRTQIKVGDVQYFDHPAIGVLALVSAD
jgi:hypothetical protein